MRHSLENEAINGFGLQIDGGWNRDGGVNPFDRLAGKALVKALQKACTLSSVMISAGVIFGLTPPLCY
jgi:hypothetical protein